MKISIVIPSTNEAKYVEQLTDYIILHANKHNIEEILIVESYSTKDIIQIAEKNHAKLYFNLVDNKNAQMEIGAFEAKAEIIYFIKPGCFPPIDFDERIIHFCKKSIALGSFDYVLNKNDSIFTKFYKIASYLLCQNRKQVNSFFVKKNLYDNLGGLKLKGGFIALKNEFKLNGEKIYC